MKKTLTFMACAALAVSAFAQQGQIHILGADGSTMLKPDEIEKITYTGDSDGYNNMVIYLTDKSTQTYALDNGIEVRGVGLPDTDLSLTGTKAESFRLLTDHAWTYDSTTGGGEGYTYDFNWFPEYINGDKITFGADHSVALDLGDTNEVYCEISGIGTTTFDPTGEEGFLLGTAEGKTYLQFTGGAFPIVRLDINGEGLEGATNARYEVVTLSSTTLEIKANISGGEYGILKFTNEDASIEDILISHAWKLIDGGTDLSALWGELTGSMDETMTFNADGSCTITSDGTIFCNDEGSYEYTPTGEESWTLGADEAGTPTITFGGGAFPLALGALDDVNGTFEIVEITSDRVVFAAPYWGGKFYTVLGTAE